MNHWLSCLLLACILFSGCALNTGSRAYTTPAPSPSRPSQSYTYSTPRNSVPVAHRPEAPQTPVTHSRHIAFLSPRMQGFNRPNPAFEGFAAASKAKSNRHGSPEKRSGDDETKIAQPAGSKTFGQISNQVVAASVIPGLGSHYARPIAIVLIFVGLICCALSQIAVIVRKAAGTIPLDGGNEFTSEHQPPGQNSGTGSRPEDAQASEGINKAAEGVDELRDTELHCSDEQKRTLQDVQSRIERTFKAN